ncbi:MAG TPA: bis(5'-nucleosyl)-tetraphosphatase (symmetrical) YqeK [Pseudogracilibacillus sp.]|nr:bis(5'-nucleosyl)-tetraphosphatase (symmetrical) YqeK [Pseudogracilibacillus sp.]
MRNRKYDAILKEKLTKDRYDHTIRVYETAIQLAKKYNAPLEKVSEAALLHDIAKCEPIENLEEAIHAYQLPVSLLEFNEELWHGPVGAKLVAEKFKIDDEEVFNSIYYHTTGRANMTLVELIIFVADYMEPGRSFPGVEEVRELAQKDIKQAAQKALQNTLIFLISKSATIHPDTIAAYNELTNVITKGRDV